MWLVVVRMVRVALRVAADAQAHGACFCYQRVCVGNVKPPVIAALIINGLGKKSFALMQVTALQYFCRQMYRLKFYFCICISTMYILFLVQCYDFYKVANSLKWNRNLQILF